MAMQVENEGNASGAFSCDLSGDAAWLTCPVIDTADRIFNDRFEPTRRPSCDGQGQLRSARSNRLENEPCHG